MKYAKFSAYTYLIFSIGFFGLGVYNFSAQEKDPWLLFAFSGVALFMYFFRLRKIKKMSDKSS